MKSDDELPIATRLIAQIALAYTALLVAQVWYRPSSIAVRLFVTSVCIWHSRALIVFARALTATEHDALEKQARVATRDPEADIYSAAGIAFWNWVAAILASNLLRLGLGFGPAILVYVSFVSISQFLLAVLLFAGFTIRHFTNRLFRIGGSPGTGARGASGVVLAAAMSPEERHLAAEHFRRTGLRPGQATVRDECYDPPFWEEHTHPPGTAEPQEHTIGSARQVRLANRPRVFLLFDRFSTSIREMNSERFYLPLAVTAASTAGLLDLPYGYYMLLRVLVCGACVYYLSKASAPGSESHKAALVALTVLHNPVIPVHLNDKNLWTVVDFATAGYFWWLSAATTTPVRNVR